MNDFITILIAYSPILLVFIYLIIAKRQNNRGNKEMKSKECDSATPEPIIQKAYVNSGLVQAKERFLAEEPVRSDYSNISDRLVELMEREKLFLNPDIRINEVAEKLFTNKSYLSKAIKETTNRNFCQLIHYFRIKEVMKIFAKNPEDNIQDIAMRVGFKSPSTFNIAFGRVSGYTPAEWSRDFKSRQNQALESVPNKTYTKTGGSKVKKS